MGGNNFKDLLRGDERIVPGITDQKYVDEHLERYRFAQKYIFGKVIDAACGVGYGSSILAQKAKKVIGLDYSEKAIEYAKKHYNGEDIEFRVFDLDKEELPSFDCAVSFETIEHLHDPVHFLRQVFKKAKLFVFSVPLHSPVSAVHLRRFDTIDEVLQLMEAASQPRDKFEFWSQKETEGDCKLVQPPNEGAYQLVGLWKK